MKNLIKLFVIIGLAGFISCTGNFEEINVNPNNPEVAPSATILTYVERQASGWYGGVWLNFNESSSMAGHITKIAYIDEARYAYRAGTVNDMFNRFYILIRNLNKIIENEEVEGGNPNMMAIALIFKCYIYQWATDHLNAIPYSDAFKAYSDKNYTPKYDSQESIYRDMLNVLKKASDMIDVNPPAYNVVTGADIIYGGNITRWKKFANSLRLRMAVRMSYVDEAGAKAVISEILGNPDKYPILSSNADNARFKWPGDANYMEPLSDAMNGTRKDYGSCDIMISVLSELDDPRLPVYARPAVSDGTYRGLIPGAASQPEEPTISRIGQFFAYNLAGYTYYFRYAEVEFLKAEIYERGLFSGDAEAAYNAGVTASLQEYTAVTPGPVTNENQIAPYLALPKVAYTNAELPLLAFAGNADTHNCRVPEGILKNECANPAVKANPKLQKIAYQKWISLFQQGLEAWAEVRRTDIPIIGPAPGRAASMANHNRCPTRYPYAFDEININGENVKAVSNGIVDLYWGQQMWWDKRTGVQ